MITITPYVVMSTAISHANSSSHMEVYWEPTDTNAQHFVYLHIAEVEELLANETREFNILQNGQLFYGLFVPTYLYTQTLYSAQPVSGYSIHYLLERTNRSAVPPILNAVEIFEGIDFPQSPTLQQDVDAIMGIKSEYGVKRNWQGDPCVPKDYVWDSLSCAYAGYNPPTIISLDLSSSGLSGEIPSYLSNLTKLQFLDLSNNSLSGEVPEFLSQLPQLKVLNLEVNSLSGSVPAELMERSHNGSLSLSLGGNPELCLSNSCQKKKKNKFVVPLAASVGTLFVVIIAVASIWFLQQRPQQDGSNSDAENENENETILKSENRHFTYSEILKITKNFERVIGKGGFGSVFHGKLENGTQVAVKMLSQSSSQGYKEFLTEVKLLMRVHHANLTTLVGYCDEGSHRVGLIYEYMANGNLNQHLSDKEAKILSWEDRLQIAIDAAKGLEYLHNGCYPPIVHRDVKSTNILLNEKLHAKIADFGLSRDFPTESDTHITRVVAGTFSYLDPEYEKTSRLNEKSDVYSFGVVLLEIVTGRPVIDKSQDDNENFIHTSQWVTSKVAEGDIRRIIDPSLGQELDKNCAWKVVESALSCASQDPENRPTMSEVVSDLNQCLVQKRKGPGFDVNGNCKYGHGINSTTKMKSV